MFVYGMYNYKAIIATVSLGHNAITTHLIRFNTLTPADYSWNMFRKSATTHDVITSTK